jgi:DNA-binding response OmpR family regulator
MLKILFVEDDLQISRSLGLNLSLNGYEVAQADTLASAWAKISQNDYDVLLLDVNLPDGSGLDLCQKIRDSGRTTPVLFLSARTDEETVVKGLKSGGDDYIRKPFGSEELRVRIERLVEREPKNKNNLRAGPLTVDLGQRLAKIKDQPLSLGKREFDILVILAKRAGDTITRDQILHSLSENPDLYDRTIDSHMSHLRRKIRDLAGESLQIAAVYGVGYRLQWKVNET